MISNHEKFILALCCYETDLMQDDFYTILNPQSEALSFIKWQVFSRLIYLLESVYPFKWIALLLCLCVSKGLLDKDWT